MMMPKSKPRAKEKKTHNDRNLRGGRIYSMMGGRVVLFNSIIRSSVLPATPIGGIVPCLKSPSVLFIYRTIYSQPETPFPPCTQTLKSIAFSPPRSVVSYKTHSITALVYFPKPHRLRPILQHLSFRHNPIPTHSRQDFRPSGPVYHTQQKHTHAHNRENVVRVSVWVGGARGWDKWDDGEEDV